MHLKQLFTNNAVSLLAAPISASSTTLAVIAGHGALFPAITEAGHYFLVTLENETATQREIIKVNGRVGDVFTGLERGWEDTIPQNWPAGGGNDTLVDHRVTAGTLQGLIHETNFGAPTTGTSIIVGDTQSANTIDTTGSNKTCKWIITIKCADGRISMAEVLAVYKPPPETPIYSIYAKVGDAVKYKINVLSTATDMSLSVENTDTSDFVEVDVIRLQHYA